MKKIFKKKKLLISNLIAITILLIFFFLIIPLIRQQGIKPQKLEILQRPNKVIYLVGEEADYSGLSVQLILKNGDKRILSQDEYELIGFNSEVPVESCIVTIKYEELITLFSVTINENIKPAPILKSISLSPLPKTEYKVGEWLNVDGAYIVREYHDGSTMTVNLLKTDVYGWDKAYESGPGKYTLTVKYVENGVMATTTFDVFIIE